MTIKILICLATVITQTLCSINTYVYTAECAPPFDNFSLTTPSPGTGVAVYPSLLPIERCCPQCEKCKHLGGSCHLRWALELYDDCICDFQPVSPCRDYSCQCCIDCQDDKCSDCSETGGECRKECRANELEDTHNKCSYHNDGDGCKCCKKCERTHECIDAYGTCVTNPQNCPFGTFPSTGCCLGCTCCKPVLTPINGTRCANTPGSYCSENDACADGFFACLGECASTNFNGGLSFQKVGYCCIPKNAASSGTGPGRIAGKFNRAIGEKILRNNNRNKLTHSLENLEAEQANRMHAQNRLPSRHMF